ncbi:DUF349 domain-containing protein [Halomonas sp. ISL-60]|uniref:DUF349 domain-containing protein n=1 Tax=Halomonas sp. ISL-56 TaxID=2819149 RepID=UPI001BE6DD88|nr:DUF349 domain-containing protein [Halomonas sp. ISL-56]MBT2774974.1 DUF349 domain-containing protein [Halomonas sp. ISL-60]MBT2803613.1 DUF349 domain-containing protein [Halomonas sp. ISL-56]
MHGLLRRLFAPRWQHPDPEVRRQALQRLNPEQAEQRQALQSLTQDSDSQIRLAALLTLDDCEGLVNAYPHYQQEEAWFNAICQRLSGSEGHSDLHQRQSLVEQIEDPRVLSAVAMQGDNLNLRLVALGKLNAEDDLIRQACHNGVAAVRHQAAERIEDEEGLKRLVKEARRDRQVVRLGRERLNRLRSDAQWLEAEVQQRETLLSQLEQHARAPWEPLYGGRFRHLERQWEQLTQPPSVEQEQRFHQALLTCRKTLHDHETQEQARQQSDERREEAENTREQLLEGIEETLDGLRHASVMTVQDIDSLRAQRQLLGQRWQALSDIHPPSEILRQRYTLAIQHYDQCLEAWQRWCAVSASIETALASGDHATLATLTSECQWPDALTPPALLGRAQAALHIKNTAPSQPAEDNTTLEAHDAELDTFEHLLERGAFKSASRLHQRLKPRIEALESPAAQPLKTRLKHLAARLAELRDWRGFVAGPKREQLCASIEALANDIHMEEEALDRHHRQLVKEWKSLGDAAANREQSARFRSASDRIHERLAPWRDQLSQERESNLQAREALCDQLESLLAQPAEDADPDVLRQIRDKARHQWRHYSPVPRERSETVGRRFGTIRHRLQTLIDQRAETIASQKRELISQVSALRNDDSQALAQRIQLTKQLQQQWRALGRAPKGEEQTLWKTFRQECDQLFALRDAHKNEQAARQQQQLDEMQTLIDEMDSWQPVEASEAATLDRFIEQASQLEPLPRNRRSEGMQRRISGIVRARRERLNRLAVADTVQQWHALMPLVNAHLAADQRYLSEGTPSDVDTQTVLSASLPSAFNEAHAARNQQRHNVAAPLSDSDHARIAESLARLRVHLSMMAVGSVRQSDEPLRLAIQVERLNEGFNQARSRDQDVTDILVALLALGPMPATLWGAEVEELDNLLSRLARVPLP